MFENLIQAVSNVLYNEFKEDCKIYIEEVKQGLIEPCFFIEMVETIQEQGLNARRKFKNLISIQYFPKTETMFELIKVKSMLYAILELIEMADYAGKKHKVRGLNMKDVISDGVLIFTVEYNYHVTTPEEKIYMDRLKQKGALK